MLIMLFMVIIEIKSLSRVTLASPSMLWDNMFVYMHLLLSKLHAGLIQKLKSNTETKAIIMIIVRFRHLKQLPDTLAELLISDSLAIVHVLASNGVVTDQTRRLLQTPTRRKKIK